METMNSFEYFLLAIKKYAVFRGRARRREYWYYVLFNIIITILINIFAVSLAVVTCREGILTPSEIKIFINIISYAVGLFFFLPSLSVAVRRLHDSDNSGWWVLCPVVNFIFLFFDSTPGLNRFGPSPKYGDGGASFTSQDQGGGLSVNNLEQIEKLARLRDQGVLTDEEFQEQKKKFF